MVRPHLATVLARRDWRRLWSRTALSLGIAMPAVLAGEVTAQTVSPVVRVAAAQPAPHTFAAAAAEPLAEEPEFAPTVQAAAHELDLSAAHETLLSNEALLSSAASTTAKPAGGKPAGPKPPPSPYKGLFYDNNFSYLDDPDFDGPFFPGDGFKRIDLPHGAKLDLGGEVRLRYQSEQEMRNSALNGLTDNFLLTRTRLFANLEAEPWRFYAEAIDAVSNYETLAPRTIEENRFDALNLFGEARLWENDGELWGRVGRQELLYGAQRLVSPLDWANTRRTFDGAKVYWRSADWDVDGFWTRPVDFGQHINNDSNFDAPDQSREFMGVYATYKGCPNEILDLYFLRLAEYGAVGSPANPVDFDANTFGARYLKSKGDLLLEFEGGYQFGDVGPQKSRAGFFTAGAGHQFADHCAKPTVWAYFDWASGDHSPGSGTRGTFNQLFPLGHKYFGFADLVARQNIIDYNLQVTATPHEKLQLMLWYHCFFLDSKTDALYNANGVPIRRDITGQSGDFVGQELDLTATWLINPRTDLLLGYSHFFAGDFVRNTNGPGVSGNASFIYSQFTYRF